MKMILNYTNIRNVVETFLFPLLGITIAFLSMLLINKVKTKRRTKKYYKDINYLCLLYGLFSCMYLTSFSLFFSIWTIGEILKNDLEEKLFDVYGACFLFPFVPFTFLIIYIAIVFDFYKKKNINIAKNVKELEAILDDSEVI